jgi:hypothetical protein
MHWPLDVLASALLGSLTALFAAAGGCATTDSPTQKTGTRGARFLSSL